jgi:hypothetical protein
VHLRAVEAVRAIASIDAGQKGRRELDALDHPEIRRVAHQ